MSKLIVGDVETNSINVGARSPDASPDWAAYRQALRDVTEQVGFPDNVTWPLAPE